MTMSEFYLLAQLDCCLGGGRGGEISNHHRKMRSTCWLTVEWKRIGTKSRWRHHHNNSTEENPSTVHYFTPTGIAVLVCLGFRIGMFKEAIISFVVVLSFLLLHCTGYGSTLNLCLSLASEVSVVIPTVVTIKYDTFSYCCMIASRKRW